MARKKKPPPQTLQKRRTCEHTIAELSVNFVQRLVLKCGFAVQEYVPDYGYDLRLDTFNPDGGMEDECVHLQLKATEHIERYAVNADGSFSFPVDAKDFQLWSKALMPVFLIFYDANLEEAYWLHIQDYAQENKVEIKGKTVRPRIPQQQVLGIGTIRLMRHRKESSLAMLKTSGEK